MLAPSHAPPLTVPCTEGTVPVQVAGSSHASIATTSYIAAATTPAVATPQTQSSTRPPQPSAMLQVQASNTERAAAARLWVPGMSPGPTMEAGSARAQEIARRREEMLGMLHDLPESEYELSLTDLVEKSGGTGGEEEAAAAAAPAPPQPSEGREQQPASGRPAGRPERRASARRRDSGGAGGGSSFRSSSDGVLLNFYMPRSLTRSFTAPRPGRTPSISGGRTPSVASECNKRERDPDAETVKCWSLLWDRRWRKSSRRDPGAPPGESAIHAASAAILKAAKHSTSPAKAA